MQTLADWYFELGRNINFFKVGRIKNMEEQYDKIMKAILPKSIFSDIKLLG